MDTVTHRQVHDTMDKGLTGGEGRMEELDYRLRREHAHENQMVAAGQQKEYPKLRAININETVWI